MQEPRFIIVLLSGIRDADRLTELDRTAAEAEDAIEATDGASAEHLDALFEDGELESLM